MENEEVYTGNCENCGSKLGAIPNTEVKGGVAIYICPCQK